MSHPPLKNFILIKIHFMTKFRHYVIRQDHISSSQFRQCHPHSYGSALTSLHKWPPSSINHTMPTQDATTNRWWICALEQALGVSVAAADNFCRSRRIRRRFEAAAARIFAGTAAEATQQSAGACSVVGSGWTRIITSITSPWWIGSRAYECRLWSWIVRGVRGRVAAADGHWEAHVVCLVWQKEEWMYDISDVNFAFLIIDWGGEEIEMGHCQ